MEREERVRYRLQAACCALCLLALAVGYFVTRPKPQARRFVIPRRIYTSDAAYEEAVRQSEGG